MDILYIKNKGKHINTIKNFTPVISANKTEDQKRARNIQKPSFGTQDNGNIE